jgi:hypothetical protein
MARKRSKTSKKARTSKKTTRPTDLVLGSSRARGVKGGKSITLKPAVFDVDVIKAPAPGGPIPVPYPN